MSPYHGVIIQLIEYDGEIGTLDSGDYISFN
jgi:hypothetical protein